MKKRKYFFHPDLKPYEKMRVVLIPWVNILLQKMMRILYRMERSDGKVSVKRYRIPGESGNVISILVYEPKGTEKKNLPCMFFMHGGGFVFNAAPHHFALARRFTREMKVKTVFIDYRLAPLHPFPAAPEDCFTVYRWLLFHTEMLGIDAEKIIVSGDSAGGNLAAVLCLMAREKGISMPKAQMLLYPVLDRRMNTESYACYSDTPMCNSRDMRKYFQMYAKAVQPKELAFLSPSEAGSLSGLPPAYLEVAQYDCLHDEGVEYAKALKQSGVPVELHEAAGAMHGYDIARKSGYMEKIMAERLCFLRKNFGLDL